MSRFSLVAPLREGCVRLLPSPIDDTESRARDDQQMRCGNPSSSDRTEAGTLCSFHRSNRDPTRSRHPRLFGIVR